MHRLNPASLSLLVLGLAACGGGQTRADDPSAKGDTEPSGAAATAKDGEPNEPKKERSFRTCAEVVPPRDASAPELTVAIPCPSNSSRKRR